MSLRFTAAPSSGIRKRAADKSPIKRRKGLGPHATKVQSGLLAAEEQAWNNRDLEEVGVLGSAAFGPNFGDADDLQEVIRVTGIGMFSSLPDSGSGLNSTRTAEILNTRKSMPPLVSKAHLRVLFESPTVLERRISLSQGERKIRKLAIPLKEAPGGMDEVLIDSTLWNQQVEEADTLDRHLKDKLNLWLHGHPYSTKVGESVFTNNEVTRLAQAGFLTLAGKSRLAAQETLVFDTNTPLATDFSLENYDHESINTNKPQTEPREPTYLNRSSHRSIDNQPDGVAPDHSPALHRMKGELNLTLPGAGIYIRLLGKALKQLLHLLSERPSGQCPMFHLRERWDGMVPDNSVSFQNRKERGISSIVLPGKTKKWREHYGLSFDWIIRESIGRGLVEVFNTESVGLGVRKGQ